MAMQRSHWIYPALYFVLLHDSHLIRPVGLYWLLDLIRPAVSEELVLSDL